MKNIQSYDEFILESSFIAKSNVFIQQNTLWVAHRPNSGNTTQIKGDPDKFRGYWSSDQNDTKHYAYNAANIADWSNWNKPVSTGKNWKLYKISAWWGYKDQIELDIWGGDNKPDYFIWLGVVKMQNGESLIHLFSTKREALGFLK